MIPIRMVLLVGLLLSGWMVAGWQTHKIAGEQLAHAKTRQARAEQVADLHRAGREAVEQARAEEQRRFEALQGVIDETEQKLARARADADAAADVGQRLRAQLSATLAGSCRGAGGYSGAAGAGPAADATLNLLADMQRRLDEASDGIARFADQAHGAGAACERSYRSLTSQPALDR